MKLNMLFIILFPIFVPIQAMNQELTLETLPSKIKAHIFANCLSQYKKKDFETIRQLTSLNKNIHRFLNDQSTVNEIIQIISKNHERKYPFVVALRLSTKGSREWFKTQAAKDSLSDAENMPKKSEWELNNKEMAETWIIGGVVYNQPNLVAALLDMGVDPNTRNRNGRSLLQIAQANKFTPIITILEYSDAQAQPLHQAAYTEDDF